MDVMKIYELRFDDDEYFYPMASFLDKAHAVAVVNRLQPFIDAEILWGRLAVHEVTVLEAPMDLGTAEEVIALLEDEPALEDRAYEMRMQLDAIRSAPEDYPKQTLALWQVELPKQEEAESEELGIDYVEQEDRPLL